MQLFCVVLLPSFHTKWYKAPTKYLTENKEIFPPDIPNEAIFLPYYIVYRIDQKKIRKSLTSKHGGILIAVRENLKYEEIHAKPIV